MDPLVFDIPTPPSTNSIWRHVGANTVLSKAYREWKRLAGYEALKSRPPIAIKDPCALTVRLRQIKNADPDNRIKAVADLLEHIGAVTNDKLFHDVRCRWDSSVPPGRCIAIIGDLEP